MSLKFDILQTPPSAEALALARESASRRIAKKNALEQRLNRVGYALTALGAVLLLWIVHLGWVSKDLGFSILAGLALSACFLFLQWVAGKLTGLRFFFAPWPLSLTFSFFVSAILALGVMPGLAAGLNPTFDSIFFSVWSGAISIIAIVVLNYVYLRWVFEPFAKAQSDLDNLVELDTSTLGDACVQYMAYVDQYAAIQVYQNQMFSLGRKPVVGEHKAAKAWVDRLAQYVETERAQKAYERMATNLTPTC